MPNHVTTIIKASPNVIASMFNADKHVDFKMVIPRHEDLDLNGATGIACSAEDFAELVCERKPLFLDIKLADMDDEVFEQFMMMVRNKRSHGFYHSMDYARKAWGTKWNAYSMVFNDEAPDTVKFETAWSHPEPVIKALSEKFPEEVISIKYADEDTGSNCGHYQIKNGVMISEEIAPPWSNQSDDEKRKWREFAFTLCNPGDDPKEWGYDENWDYIEE